jgi:hypothetical protein
MWAVGWGRRGGSGSSANRAGLGLAAFFSSTFLGVGFRSDMTYNIHERMHCIAWVVFVVRRLVCLCCFTDSELKDGDSSIVVLASSSRDEIQM